MSNIIAFRPERTSRSTGRSTEPKGRILFFTGIRYVRDEEPAEAALRLVPCKPGSPDGERLKA